ncbi:hypothetical protein Emag_005906 [Eimeria magna]
MQKDSGTLGAFPCHFSHGTQLVNDDAAAAAAAAAAEGEGEEGESETAAADDPQDHAAAAAAAAAAAKRKLCLYLYSFPTDSSPFAVELTPCNSQDPGQQLEFVP